MAARRRRGAGRGWGGPGVRLPSPARGCDFCQVAELVGQRAAKLLKSD